MGKSEATEKKNKHERMEEKTGAKTRKTLMVAIGIIVVVVLVSILAFYQFNPRLVAPGDNVSVYYTGMLDNGTIFDTNVHSTPLVVTVGSSNIIPGFSNALVGMKVNQIKTVTIPFDQAYGPYQPELVHIVNRTGELANTSFTAGQYYTIRDRMNGAVSTIKIINVSQTTIAWDENSPLAGQNLTFTLQVTGIS
jgi:peptidylprolyl isomerase